MELTAAPFLDDIDAGPPGGAAHWARAADGVRIRVGHRRPEGAGGTVLLFPGRTEYIEKYGTAAGVFADQGLATLAIDWRGQGLADRLTEDRRIGHVARFGDYQLDVAAALEVATGLDLPRPWFLLGHSMGGAIGLRAAMDGLAVRACAFTGPMWGIRMSPLMRPMGWAMSHVAPLVGLGLMLPPGSTHENYVESDPFEGNVLTTDPGMFAMLQEHLRVHPELSLGGPSLIWLREALAEIRRLAARPSPDLDCMTFLGADEQIVDTAGVHARMAKWPRGELRIVAGSQHEVMMERPEIRGPAFDRMIRHFHDHAD